MALSVTHKCRFPNDLDFATKQLDAELASRILANQLLLKEAEDSTSDIDTLLDEGNEILNSFFTKNDAPASQRPTSEKANLASTGSATVDNQPSSSYETSSDLKSTDDVADTFGLLPDNSTEEQEEKFITNTGLVLFNNVAYLPGKQSGNSTYYDNIKILRRLYFALDTKLDKTKEILNNYSETVFVNDKLNFRVLPPKKYQTAYTIDEIKTLLSLDYLTENDVVTTHDYHSIVLLKTLLAVNKSKAEILRTSGIPEEELVSNIFHMGSIDNSTKAISKYNFFGYNGDEVGAILAGQDMVYSNISVITGSIESSRVLVNKLIAYIDFFKSKYASLSTSYRRESSAYIKANLYEVLKVHKKTISSFFFQVSTILQKDIITQLNKKHTDDKVEYLLRKRLDVDDLWFDPPDDDFLRALRRSMDATPVGSTYISNKAINSTKTYPISQKELLWMYADIYDALSVTENSNLTVNDLGDIRQYLSNFLARQPETSADANLNILQGQPSAATGAGILTERMDTLTTMNFEDKKQAVKDSYSDLLGFYPPQIAGPLSEIIDKVVTLFEKALRAINRLIAQAQKLLLKLKKRLDSFISKYLSLIGNASFSNSLLKCAINWDIGVSTDILDRLFDFFFRFMGKVLAFLASLKKWISDLFEKILCLPVDLLNNFLGQVQVSLPSACKIPRFDLGKQLSTSLNGLKNVSTAENFVLRSFSKDIAKLRVEVRASSDKLTQFKTSSSCSSSASSNFMNASMLNVGISVGVG
jgi:hypothetical protein